MINIEEFFVEEYGCTNYIKVRLSDKNNYYMNCGHTLCTLCEWYYRSDNSIAKFTLTKRPVGVLHSLTKSSAFDFIAKFSKEVFINQFSEDCNYTMKYNGVKITEFSEVADLLRINNRKSNIQFYIKNE